MKNSKLNFIPSQRQITKFYRSLHPNQSLTASPLSPSSPTSLSQHQFQIQPQQPSPRKLTKTQVSELLQRLNPNNQQNIVKQQIRKIQQLNQEWQDVKEKRDRRGYEVEERLLMEGRRREERLEALRKAKERQEMKELKEKPMITDRYLANYKPLKDRVPNIIELQKQNVRNIEAKNKPKFNPEINRYSAFIAELKNENEGDFGNRLHQNKKAEESKRLIRSQIEESIKREATFKPRINENSKKIAKVISESNNDKENIRKSQNKHLPDKHNFQPQICKRSQQIIKLKNGSSFDHRLQDDYQNRKARQLELQQIRNQEFSFKPKINSNSRRLASAKPSCQPQSSSVSIRQDQEKDVSGCDISNYDEVGSGRRVGEMNRKQWSSVRKIGNIGNGLIMFENEVSRKNQEKLEELFGNKRVKKYK